MKLKNETIIKIGAILHGIGLFFFGGTLAVLGLIAFILLLVSPALIGIGVADFFSLGQTYEVGFSIMAYVFVMGGAMVAIPDGKKD